MSTLKLNYEDLLSAAEPGPPPSRDDYRRWTATSEDWGFYQERHFALDHLAVREIVTDFQSDCAVGVRDAGLPDSIHIRTPLFGWACSDYHTCQLSTKMRPRMHHYLYVPATEYEWTLSKNLRLVDIKIDKQYFAALLSDDEPWAAKLREKLLRRVAFQSPQRMVCSGMQQILHDILFTPLTGSLKKIFIEAKVLELVALQLHHSKCEPAEDVTLKKKDQETLAAIHEYLARNFTEEHSLKGLSKAFGLNEFMLKKGFKSLYGKTVFDYLFELKMSHARHLLLEEGKMVCEVARLVGYKNPNHFSTAFKKKFGIAPLLLRQ